MPVQRSIVITGFMGSGKTSAANALAKLLRCSTVDLDNEIARREGRTPAELITQSGEAAFREIESAILRNVLERGPHIVALGGGAWTIAANRTLIAEFNGFSIWLDVPFERCWRRIDAAGSNRPLAPDRQTAKALYDLRRPLYELAELRIEARDVNADSLARRVVAALPNNVAVLPHP